MFGDGDVAAQLVRPGGSLTYVVCSLLPGEGEARIERFLGHDKGFAASPFGILADRPPVASLILSPGANGCDGFFIARLQRVC